MTSPVRAKLQTNQKLTESVTSKTSAVSKATFASGQNAVETSNFQGKAEHIQILQVDSRCPQTQ